MRRASNAIKEDKQREKVYLLPSPLQERYGDGPSKIQLHVLMCIMQRLGERLAFGIGYILLVQQCQ